MFCVFVWKTFPHRHHFMLFPSASPFRSFWFKGTYCAPALSSLQHRLGPSG